MKSKKIYIKGMHCVACEKLLKDEFDAVRGVIEAKVDRKTDSAELFYESEAPDFSEIKKVSQKYGYDAFETKEELRHSMSKSGKMDWTEWLQAALVLIVMLFIYQIVKNAGWLDKLDIQAANVTLGVAFLTGVIASVSTCLAVVGSVVIAFGEKYKSEGRGFYNQALKPNLQFHAGRLASFFILGGLLGAIGGELSISGRFYFIFNIIIAAVMGWLGLSILGILPSISNLGVRMPKIFTKHWDNLKESEHKAAPFLLGALSFFLPCGFTQSMQIFALVSGSFWLGGTALLAFALGTLPALLALGAAASWIQGKKMAVFQKVAGLLIVIFAIYTFNSGWALKDVKGSVLSTPKNIDNSQITTGNDIKDEKPKPIAEQQTVIMKVNSRGFDPPVMKIKAGVPVQWIVRGEQVSGCTNQIIVPSLDITQNIKSGDNIIQFTPKEKGTINFSCWMGMVRGKFIVE